MDNQLVKILLVYYLLNMTTQSTLLSKQLREYIDDNRLVKHAIGLVTIIVLLSLVYEHDSSVSFIDIIMYGLLCYALYITSTKLDLQWNIIVLCLLGMAYGYEYNKHKKQYEMDKDLVLTQNEKNNINDRNNKKSLYMLAGVISAIGIGMYLYSEKKQVQYGGGFSMMQFLLY